MNSLKSLLLIALSCSSAFSSPTSTGDTPSLRQDAELIRQLGADRAEDRDKAEQKIWNRGKELLPLLEQAARGDDPEVTERANGLIAKIKLALKPDVPSVQSEFADQYLKADDEKKGELMAEFLEREDLTADETRSAIRLQMQSVTENGAPALPNDWQLDKLDSVLKKETIRLLKENKIPEVVELWSDIDFSPRIRHRYAALLHNSGLPFDETRFSAQDSALMKTELALLKGDVETAKKQMPEGDPYTAKQIAAAELDLSALWQQELEDAASATDDDQSQLPLLWAIARRDGDKKAQQQIINKLSQKKTLSSDMDMNFGLGCSEEMMAWLLLSCGEMQKAIDLTAQSQPNDNGMGYQVPFSLSCAAHQDFNPVLLGAKGDTLEDILALAESLSPLKNDESPRKHISAQQESAKQQKLITLAYYLEVRGEGSKILPYLKAHLKSLPKENLLFASVSYIIMFKMSELHELAFELYKIASRENLLAENKVPAERTLASDLDEDGLAALLRLAEIIHPESKNREDRLETVLKLTANLPVRKEELKALQAKAWEWVTQHKNEPETELIVTSLIETMCFSYFTPEDMLVLLDAYGKPALPKSLFARIRFINSMATMASPEWKRRYLDYLSQMREKASATPDNNWLFQPFGGIPESSIIGEYIAVLQDSMKHKGEAQKVRRQERLLSPSEKSSRQLEAILATRVEPTADILKKSLPYSFTDPESANVSIIAICQNSFYYNTLIFKCFEEGLFKEASFLAENIVKENLISPSRWSSNYRGIAELSRGLHEWKEGKKEQAMESLSLAKDLMDNEYNGLLYLTLIHYIPEQTETWKKWYEAQRAQKLEILKKWPGFDRLKGEIILPGLLMNCHFDESVKMIEEMSPLGPGQSFLFLLAQISQERKQGNIKETRRLIGELKRTYAQNGEPYITLISKELDKQESGVAAP